MGYPAYRSRRLRQLEPLRRLVREERLSVEQLVMPLFVRPGKNIRSPIPSMPGQFQLTVDQLGRECKDLQANRVGAVLLFAVAQPKDEKASAAYAKDGVIQQAIQAIKADAPELIVMTDVCLCAYMPHGHCGVLKTKLQAPKSKSKSKKSKQQVLQPSSERDWSIDNDASLALLSKVALSHAVAGADMVSPSDMMDGRIAAIRKVLDEEGFSNLSIMSYAAKYASNFYAPFREAASSSPAFGDRKSYQLDIANSDEALREAAADIEEGADILMVKPALSYLDVVSRIKTNFNVPVAAFNVSGEYAMVKAASARGWLIERPTVLEMLVSIRRAGADMIVTYWAKEAAKLLQER